ncbi:MAG: molybdenum cofactor guanylyltransferase [Bacilli bacterium]
MTAPVLPAFSAVILAGGHSRRMGSDKATLELDASMFVDVLYAKMAAIVEDVWVVRRKDQQSLQIPLVAFDAHPGQGPLAGLESGLAHCRCEWTFAIAVDAPLVRVELLLHLARLTLQRADGDDGKSCHPATAIVPTFRGQKYPLLGVYHKSLRPVITKMLTCDRRRVSDLLAQVCVRYVPEEEWRDYDPEGVSFLMVNTPAEYETVRRVARGMKGSDGNETGNPR